MYSVFGDNKSCGYFKFSTEVDGDSLEDIALQFYGVNVSCGSVCVNGQDNGVVFLRPIGSCYPSFGCIEIDDGFRTTTTDPTPTTIPCSHFGTP